MRVLFSTAALAWLAAQGSSASAADNGKPNVLMIAVDDLNHWVKHLRRNPQTITPNIDRLAKRGVTFTHAYTASPSCNPSRAALMSGIRPTTSGVYSNEIDWRPIIDRSRMLTTHFRTHGYFVGGAGKIYHHRMERRDEWDAYTEGSSTGPIKDCKSPRGVSLPGGIDWEAGDCRDEQTGDYMNTSWIIEQLGRKHDKPFLLTAGIFRPHVPWVVPKKYFDMHPLASIRLPPHRPDDLDDVPEAGKKIAAAYGNHAKVLESGRWKEAIQAYLASITSADVQVGRLIDALEKSTYARNTIVVLFSDHGWHLGEKSHWHKYTLWEEGTRVPYIWVVPGLTKAGGVSTRTVDLMSLYPTLSQLCGLPIPEHVEGVSIKPLLASPRTRWERPALTNHFFGNHAVRTEQWRYIRYQDGSEELYDERKDPYEWTNLAGKPALAAIKTQLAQHLPKLEVPKPPNTPQAPKPTAVPAE
jgi:arylsulfatase A-like enzyme